MNQPPPPAAFFLSPSSTQPTSQTSGFNSGSGSGLGSSPNVPKPGSTIDPATGQPHKKGLTRAELAAMQAKSATESQGGAGVYSDLSGREQAARQLLSTANTSGQITPGLELPGGWGGECASSSNADYLAVKSEPTTATFGSSQTTIIDVGGLPARRSCADIS